MNIQEFILWWEGYKEGIGDNACVTSPQQIINSVDAQLEKVKQAAEKRERMRMELVQIETETLSRLAREQRKHG